MGFDTHFEELDCPIKSQWSSPAQLSFRIGVVVSRGNVTYATSREAGVTTYLGKLDAFDVIGIHNDFNILLVVKTREA
jgi:hypothetical protein